MKTVNQIWSKKKEKWYLKKSNHRELRTVAVYYGNIKGKFKKKRTKLSQTPVVKSTKKIKISHYYNQYDITIQEDKPFSKLVKN